MKRYIDLLLLFAFILAASAAAFYFLTEMLGTRADLVVAIGATLLSAVYLRISNRQTVTAVFRADISGLLEIIGNLEILPYYHSLVDDPQLATRFYSEPKEDYFATYSSNSNSMGFLPPETAAEITSFYLYLKAARDVRQRILVWQRNSENGNVDEDAKVKDIDAILKMMQQCEEHGCKALHLLGESQQRLSALCSKQIKK